MFGLTALAVLVLVLRSRRGRPALPSRMADWNAGSMSANGDSVVSQFLKVDENLDAAVRLRDALGGIPALITPPD